MALPQVHPPAVLTSDARRLGRFAREAARYAWIERLSRLGLLVRGVMYFVTGALALKWALGQHHVQVLQPRAIDAIGHQPLGRVLLSVVSLGLAGYVIWGLVRALLDPLGRGHSPSGIALRIGYATSAIAYAGLLVTTLQMLAGSASATAPHRDWTAALLAHRYGSAMVVVIGLFWLGGSGIAQIVNGYRLHFERDLALERTSPRVRRWIMRFGRFGLVSRGIVFSIIGVLLIAAALHLRPETGSGLEGALFELAHQPLGLVLLAAAGLGLMAFGAYSAMCARWMRMTPIPVIPITIPARPYPR